MQAERSHVVIIKEGSIRQYSCCAHPLPHHCSLFTAATSSHMHQATRTKQNVFHRFERIAPLISCCLTLDSCLAASSASGYKCAEQLLYSVTCNVLIDSYIVSHALGNKQACPSAQVIAHSMGAWAAYEFLNHARANGLSMPVQAFLSAMPHPDIAFEQRPWKQQASLDEAQFQVTLGSPYKCYTKSLHSDVASMFCSKTQLVQQRFALVI